MRQRHQDQTFYPFDTANAAIFRREIMFRVCLIALLTLPVILTSASAADDQDWGKVPEEQWALKPSSDFADANAVVVFNLGSMHVTTNHIKLHRHVRIKVFNETGAEDAGDVSIYYYEDDKLKGLKAHTITPDGKKHKVEGKNIYEKVAGSRKIKTFSFPNIQNGSIIEYRYDIIHERYGHLDPWYFQGELYTLLSAFTLILDPGFAYSTSFRNVPRSRQQAAQEDNLLTHEKSFTWTLTGLPAVSEEPYMGYYFDFVSSLHCQLVSYENVNVFYTYIRGWPELGAEYTEFVDEYTRKSGDLKGLVADVISSAQTPLDKAGAIYDHVCCQIKAKDDENGRSYTHDNLQNVLENKYGTPEEKNLLAIAMLREAGFEAWPVLISTRDHGVFKPDVYQLRQFNYLIAYTVIDAVGYFLDTSTKYCPFGMLPPECLATGGFLLDGKKSETVRIFSEAKSNYRRDSTNISLEADGSTVCSTSVRLGGYFTAELGRQFETEEKDDFARKRFLDKLDLDCELIDLEFSQDTATTDCLIGMSYSASDQITQLGENILVSPVSFCFAENPFVSKERSFPVDFNYPFTYENVTRVRLGDELSAAELPANMDVEIPGARFLRQTRTVDGVVTVRCKLDIIDAVFAPGQYSQLRDFFSRVSEAATEQIVLVHQ